MFRQVYYNKQQGTNMINLTYSLTFHADYNKIYFYKLNVFIKVAKDVVLTGEVINQLEASLTPNNK